jgi:hypothetical protein
VSDSEAEAMGFSEEQVNGLVKGLQDNVIVPVISASPHAAEQMVIDFQQTFEAAGYEPVITIQTDTEIGESYVVFALAKGEHMHRLTMNPIGQMREFFEIGTRILNEGGE